MVFPSFILHEVERLLDVTDNNASSHRVKTHDEVGKFLKDESLSLKQFIVGIKEKLQRKRFDYLPRAHFERVRV